jgi:hypothetical protein
MSFEANAHFDMYKEELRQHVTDYLKDSRCELGAFSKLLFMLLNAIFWLPGIGTALRGTDRVQQWSKETGRNDGFLDYRSQNHVAFEKVSNAAFFRPCAAKGEQDQALPRVVRLQALV